MISFRAAEWITVTGRGKIAIITEPWDDLSLLKNQVVMIDDTEYLVRGVDSFYPRKPSSPFGLLVSDPGNRPAS